MLLRPILFVSLLLAACGGSADLSSGSPESGDPKPSQNQNQNQGGPATGSDGSEMPANIPTRDVEVRLHNATKGEVRLVKDYQAPLWLEIGSPAYQLNGYGQSWCGNKNYGHNEPVFLEQKIAPGASITTKWNGNYVTFDDDGSCWKFEKAPSGSLSARACIYENTDVPGRLSRKKEANPFPAGPGDKGAPSTWFENAPTRCVPFTIELKDGGSVVDVVIAP